MTLGPIICDVEGLSLNPQDIEILKHPLVGGLIFFARNYESPAQLRELVTAIKAVRPDILLSVDQEGGRVQRFKEGFTKLPCLGELGALYDSNPSDLPEVLKQAQKLGHLMASEIRSFGIDISYAPVVDCNKGLSKIVGDRAFHSNPEIIVQLASAYIKGMQQAGMSATLKHFPGHGSVVPDSHLELPVDDRAMSNIEVDMSVFAKLIQSNQQGIDAVMPAHIIYSQVDDKPACFSSIWLKDILRNQIGFNGVIISDDLTMEAASVIGDVPTRAQTALDAGCDNILICNNPDAVRQTLDKLQDERDNNSKQRLNTLISNAPSTMGAAV